jgi:hypothetical protein
MSHDVSQASQKQKKLSILYTCEGSNLKLFSYTKKKEKKNYINKNQGWEAIQQEYKAKRNTSRHHPKKK